MKRLKEDIGMRRGIFRRYFTYLLSVVAFTLCSLDTGIAQSRRPVTPREIVAVTQAIVDEIYDYGRQKEFYFVGEADGDSRKVVVYIRPYIIDDVGQVVYRYMPFGEVIRYYTIESTSGVATLNGDPSLNYPFPATQPDTRTVFLSDSYMCRLRTRWSHSSFTVMLNPTPKQFEDAAKRQVSRVGYSFRLANP
jgi:hypothetical protein